MIDEVSFLAKAGNGGNGAVSFRREKYAPKGGPDGGDGGRGGSIWLVADKGVNTLAFFSGKDRFEAAHGGRGLRRKQHGQDASDIELKVPVGTVVWELGVSDDSEQDNDQKEMEFERGLEELHGKDQKDKRIHEKKRMLFDLVEDGQRVCIAVGGNGGRGNFHFRSSTNTTPQEYESGTKGEKRMIRLELKVLAQVGLVGLPNAGKSTLLSVLTKAQPKIANYPFTTLSPNLGAMKMPGKNDHLIIADIPGLIEGASEGKGLGVQFLRHIERCRVLVFVIAPSEEILAALEQQPESLEQRVKMLAEYFTNQLGEVKNELELYKESLLTLPKLTVMNKVDLLDPELVDGVVKLLAKQNLVVKPVSAVTGEGLEGLAFEITRLYDTILMS